MPAFGGYCPLSTCNLSEHALGSLGTNPASRRGKTGRGGVGGESGRVSYATEVRAYLEAVNDALHEALLEYRTAMPLSLITLGKVVLSAPGKVMSAVPLMQQGRSIGENGLPSPLPRWPLYVVASYIVASGGKGDWREALPGAVAVELAMAAADLLDELADSDPSPVIAEYGPGQALNTASLMLVMAQQVLLKAALGARTEQQPRSLAALYALQEMLIESAVGQHLDMLYDRMEAGEVSLEMSVEVTEKKAGALIAGAYRVGALIAGAEGELLDLLTRLGRATGNIAQVVNDLQDVLPMGLAPATEGGSAPEHKTDLLLRKRTLPIVFTLRDDSEMPNALQLAFAQEAGAPIDEEALRHAIVEAGGAQFANLIIEVQQQNILEILAELEQLRSGASLALAPLLPVAAEPSQE